VENPPQLLDIATAVADLTPVDWVALEAEAGDAVGRAALKRLRLLDTIVRACADIVPPGTAGPGAADDIQQTTWGPFTIHERIGRGTFGDVYRAHDRRLDRIVALKLLRPGREGGDPVESEVIHEGQLLAKARHPNVVTVHGAERIDGRVGVWMEFVDGRTLEEELRASGPLPAASVIEVGLTLCRALAAVHDAGLLHRDLKAQNVMRATDGRLLLTDFGAGRTRSEALGDGTRGELAGTPLYLAPELLGGAPASVTSEVYSLGVLLYHLATGSFPVRGRTLQALREAHARGERVGMQAYRDTVPKALAAVVDRATESDPAKRFESVQVLHGALLRTRPRRRRLVVGAVSIVSLALLVVAGLNARWAMAPPLRIVSRQVIQGDPSRIGLLFAKDDRLYFGREGRVFSLIPGQADSERTEFDGSSPFSIVDVSISQGYLALGNGTNELWIFPASGQPRRVGGAMCDVAVWSPDGRRIACAESGTLSIVTADGGSSRTLPAPPGAPIHSLSWSPHGDVLRFVVRAPNRDRLTPVLWEVRADGTGLRRLLPGWSDVPRELRGGWILDGRYFVFQAASDDGRFDLWALREPRGVLDWTRPQPVRLTSGPESFGGPMVVSPDGATLITAGTRRQSELVKLDRDGHRFEPYLGGLSAVSLTFSPDGRAVAYIRFPEMTLWRADADGSHARQLIHAPVEMRGAAWSPDNRWIAFVSRLEGESFKIFLLPADGSGAPRAISPDDKEQGNPSWSPDGRQLCYGDVPKQFGIPDGGEVLHIYEIATGRQSVVPGSEGLWTCRWSPDGRYIAGLRIGVGSRQMTIKVLDTKLGTWRELTDAHHVGEPSWSHDSRFIYYNTISGPAVLRRVRVETGAVEDVKSLVDYPALQWSGLTTDDSPLVLHLTGSDRFYALKLGER